MNYSERWNRAAALGKAAFDRGAKSIPAHDPAMMETLRGREIGDRRTLPELWAWSQGWHRANAAAPWQ